MNDLTADMPTASPYASLSYSKDAIIETFSEMIEERTSQYLESDHNPKLTHQLTGYVMALEDAFYRLFGYELGYGQDIEPIEQSDESPF